MDKNAVSSRAAVTGALRSALPLAILHIRVRLACVKLSMLDTVNARVEELQITAKFSRTVAIVASLNERVVARIYIQSSNLARKNVPIL
jgi:hypothetical protein